MSPTAIPMMRRAPDFRGSLVLEALKASAWTLKHESRWIGHIGASRQKNFPAGKFRFDPTADGSMSTPTRTFLQESSLRPPRKQELCMTCEQ